MKPKAFADGIPVYCAYDAIVKITDLIENPRNPNRHPQSQITKGAKIIKGNGWRQSIVVSKRSGMITKGHGRRLFAIEGGLTGAPVDYQDYESEAAEWADVLADNELALEAEIELSEVKGILDEVDFSNYDIELTGYNLDDLLSDIGDTELDPNELGDSFSLPDGGKPPFQQMTFTLADQQAERVKELLNDARHNNEIETFDNENGNGNALYRVFVEWGEQRK